MIPDFVHCNQIIHNRQDYFVFFPIIPGLPPLESACFPQQEPVEKAGGIKFYPVCLHFSQFFLSSSAILVNSIKKYGNIGFLD
jgi:hypothetical protein